MKALSEYIHNYTNMHVLDCSCISCFSNCYEKYLRLEFKHFLTVCMTILQADRSFANVDERRLCLCLKG